MVPQPAAYSSHRRRLINSFAEHPTRPFFAAPKPAICRATQQAAVPSATEARSPVDAG